MTSIRAKAAQNILQLVGNARLKCPHHAQCNTEALVSRRQHSHDGSKVFKS